MGLSDDVESDGDIRFLIRLRIFDKILGYIIYRIFSTKMAFSICYAQSFAMSSKRAWMTELGWPISYQGSEEFDAQNRNPLKNSSMHSFKNNFFLQKILAPVLVKVESQKRINLYLKLIIYVSALFSSLGYTWKGFKNKFQNQKFSLLDWRVFLMGVNWIEKQLYTLKLHIKSRSNNFLRAIWWRRIRWWYQIFDTSTLFR